MKLGKGSHSVGEETIQITSISHQMNLLDGRVYFQLLYEVSTYTFKGHTPTCLDFAFFNATAFLFASASNL